MAKKWQPSKTKGVRFYTLENKPRLRNKNQDRCWGIRYQVNGKVYEAILGWTSEGWTEGKSKTEREKYINNIKTAQGAASPAESKKFAKQKREEQKKLARIEKRSNISFKDFAEEEYFPVNETGWKSETARKHKEHCKNWLYPIIGDKPIKKVSLQDLKKIRAGLRKKKRSPRTQQYIFRTFDMIWTYARDEGIVIPASPTKKKSFKLPKIKNERERFLDFDEAYRLIAAVKNRSLQAYHMTVLSLHSGMRFSEVARLQWQHVNVEEGLIRVFDAKGSNRTLKMSLDVIKLFKNLERDEGGRLVFPNTKDEIQKQVPSSFKRAIKDVGLNDGITDPKLKFGFHGLRHTRASWLRKAGADLYTIQKILGHKTPTMTQRYSHIENKEIKDITKAVDDLLKKDRMIKKSKDKKITQLHRQVYNV